MGEGRGWGRHVLLAKPRSQFLLWFKIFISLFGFHIDPLTRNKGTEII